MQNIGSGQFTYDILKAAYDSDPRIAGIITDFDQEMVRLKSSEMDDLKPAKSKGKNKVKAMAKKAVDLDGL
jgi:hypothetical protein